MLSKSPVDLRIAANYKGRELVFNHYFGMDWLQNQP